MSNTFVSIIIPCYNEEILIGRCLDSIITNDYPKHLLEVLVVDGMSTDRTYEILMNYTHEYPFIRILKNIKKFTPHALNIGVEHSRGEIIVRMDAHTLYPKNYISRGVEILNGGVADVVGGPIISEPGDDTLIAKTIAFVVSHPFGVGNSKFRTTSNEGYVDTVPFGLFNRAIFDDVGLFNEELNRNQDIELNSRIIKKGYRIFQLNDLTTHYYCRSTIKGLLKQAFETGKWNAIRLKHNPSAFRWRHYIPFFFLLSLSCLSLFSLFSRSFFYLTIAFVCLYATIALFSAMQISQKNGFKYFPVLPFVFISYHLVYGAGTSFGLIKIIYSKVLTMTKRTS